MRRLAAIMVLLCVAVTGHARDGMDIYFVRHAETLSNASRVNNSENSNTFSAKGIEQITTLTGKLKRMHFDAILVSSVPRAINTILPYLKETGQKAEIWPEVAECCWQHDRGDITAGKLILTSKIQLSAEQEAYFSFRDTNSANNYGNDSYADGVAHVRHAEDLLKQRYFGSGKTVLIVGHYHSGDVLLSDLLGIPFDELPSLRNAQLAHLHQGDDGRFTLVSINE